MIISWLILIVLILILITLIIFVIQYKNILFIEKNKTIPTTNKITERVVILPDDLREKRDKEMMEYSLNMKPKYNHPLPMSNKELRDKLVKIPTSELIPYGLSDAEKRLLEDFYR